MTTDPKHTGESDFQTQFERVYLTRYPGMLRFAREYIPAREDAENIVHDAFLDVWEMRKNYHCLTGHLPAILLTSIKNKCIDYLRHKIVVRETETRIQEEHLLDMQLKFRSLEALNPPDEELENILTNAIQNLPERCREIFIKNKFEGKKQKEIAEEFNISLNTVENHMAAAYKKLKQILKNYLP
jgi:RNA polymerase sigma-70 factor (ECF subfamily)